MQNETTNHLRPCPFCGSDTANICDNNLGDCHALCPACFATGPLSEDQTSATVRWNNRCDELAAIDHAADLEKIGEIATDAIISLEFGATPSSLEDCEAALRKIHRAIYQDSETILSNALDEIIADLNESDDLEEIGKMVSEALSFADDGDLDSTKDKLVTLHDRLYPNSSRILTPDESVACKLKMMAESLYKAAAGVAVLDNSDPTVNRLNDDLIAVLEIFSDLIEGGDLLLTGEVQENLSHG